MNGQIKFTSAISFTESFNPFFNPFNFERNLMSVVCLAEFEFKLPMLVLNWSIVEKFFDQIDVREQHTTAAITFEMNVVQGFSVRLKNKMYQRVKH